MLRDPNSRGVSGFDVEQGRSEGIALGAPDVRRWGEEAREGRQQRPLSPLLSQYLLIFCLYVLLVHGLAPLDSA